MMLRWVAEVGYTRCEVVMRVCVCDLLSLMAPRRRLPLIVLATVAHRPGTVYHDIKT